jgi:hypothetical protein
MERHAMNNKPEPKVRKQRYDINFKRSAMMESFWSTLNSVRRSKDALRATRSCTRLGWTFLPNCFYIF